MLEHVVGYLFSIQLEWTQISRFFKRNLARPIMMQRMRELTDVSEDLG